MPDATISTLAFFSMCNWGYQWYRPGGDVGYRDVALNFWRTFMSGVAVKPPPTPTWEAPANGQVRTP